MAGARGGRGPSRASWSGRRWPTSGLVTTLVHYASAPAIFASLYVLVIAAYAVLLPPQLGVLVTLFATVRT